MLKHLLVPGLAAALGISAPVLAQSVDGDAFAEALTTLNGDWSGTLEYRDYRSNERVFLPHARTVSTGPAGEYILTENAFTDPGYTVHAAELTSWDGERMRSVYSRGGSFEVSESQLVKFEQTENGWRAELRSHGSDNGQPAEIRYLWSLNGDSLRAERQARTDTREDFVFRNRIEVERQARGE
ncbi:hypothetical protein [Maricaulis sp.]|uniref:hypothetical protein n=1 Tax=Maricaulis sp. TaxID=1486257 RepID=UPI002639B224|nr:hypothetical protein [Maricaulis sp.]